MMYIVVHYSGFGFEEETLFRTPCLITAMNECRRYGNNDDIEEGYEVRDENNDLVRV